MQSSFSLNSKRKNEACALEPLSLSVQFFLAVCRERERLPVALKRLFSFQASFKVPPNFGTVKLSLEVLSEFVFLSSFSVLSKFV